MGVMHLPGIALFLTHLAKSGKKCSSLRRQYPDYVIAKKKLTLQPGTISSEYSQGSQKRIS